MYVALDRGEPERALPLIEQSIDVMRRAGDVQPGDLELALAERAAVLRALGRFDDALAQADEAAQLARSREQWTAVANAELERGRALVGLRRRPEAEAALASALTAAERRGPIADRIRAAVEAELARFGGP
jgi:tetratricopeptide (TPR) repeat protein